MPQRKTAAKMSTSSDCASGSFRRPYNLCWWRR